MSLKSTVVGPYPRVGSKCGDLLRKEINKLYEGTGDAERVGSLKVDLTKEVVQEMVSAGIEVPNYGLIDVHDELTWPLEHVAGVELGGMKKIFHTNTHYKEAVVTGEIRRKHSLLSDL
jgi:methionine synthase II (cobalamin-independent)